MEITTFNNALERIEAIISNKVTVCSLPESVICTPNEAKKAWETEVFQHATNVAWEYMRNSLLKHDNRLALWMEHFETIKSFADTFYKNRISLISKFAYDKDEYISVLPFIGYIGEVIAFNGDTGDKFFSRQIPYYEANYIVCGWQGEYSKESFIYPTGNFFIINE